MPRHWFDFDVFSLEGNKRTAGPMSRWIRKSTSCSNWAIGLDLIFGGLKNLGAWCGRPTCTGPYMGQAFLHLSLTIK
jgi:hypothetical protein